MSHSSASSNGLISHYINNSSLLQLKQVGGLHNFFSNMV